MPYNPININILQASSVNTSINCPDHVRDLDDFIAKQFKVPREKLIFKGHNVVGIRKNDKILALSGDGLKAYDNANFDIENNVIKANVNGLEIYRSIIPLAVFSKSALHLSAYKIDDQDIYKIVHKEQLAGGQNGFNINIKITPNQFNTYPEKAIPLENGEPESDLRRNLNNLTIDSNDIELNRLAQQDLTSDQAKRIYSMLSKPNCMDKMAPLYSTMPISTRCNLASWSSHISKF